MDNGWIMYKGYAIDFGGVYGLDNFITVQYCGDDVVFNTVEEAREFIDEITKEVCAI